LTRKFSALQEIKIILTYHSIHVVETKDCDITHSFRVVIRLVNTKLIVLYIKPVRLPSDERVVNVERFMHCVLSPSRQEGRKHGGQKYFITNSMEQIPS